MILSDPEQWRLQIFPDKYLIQGHRTFSGIATSRFPKIYIFSDQSGPVYVGITKRSMSQRLAHGFKASGKGGYYGYAFRRPDRIQEYKGMLSLTLWEQRDPSREVREGQPILNADSTARWSLADVEKVEAELVYFIRHETGSWPKYQTEIHFSKPEPEHQAAAKQIWKDLDKQIFLK